MENRKVITAFLLSSLLFSSFYLLLSARSVRAFESSSGSFELHAGDIESTVGTSTSASFKVHNAGGQNATATSTSGSTKGVFSGILYWLYGFFTNQYDQAHYRWRNDDGTQVTATWPVNEDFSYVSFPKNSARRLRIEISNEGWTRSGTPALTLEVAQTATCSSGTYAAVPATYGSAWVVSTSTNITDGEVTSNVGTPPTTGLTDAGAVFVAGQAKDTGNTTSAITPFTSENFTEVEYVLTATSVATDGATYCFRLTNSGATSGTGYIFTYSQYAKAVLASGLSPTGTLDSAIFDTFTTTGATQGPAYNSIMWKGTQNGSSGKVQFQLATSDSSSGPWTFYGSDGTTCNTTNYYSTNATQSDTPVELSCSPTYHNNQRYFRYRVRLCSSDCTASGSASPIVNDVIVNWAP